MKTIGKWTVFAFPVKKMPPAEPDSVIDDDTDYLRMRFRYLLTLDSTSWYCPVALSGEFGDGVVADYDVHLQTSQYSGAQFDYPKFGHLRILSHLFDCLSSLLEVILVDEVGLTELNRLCSVLNLVLQLVLSFCFHSQPTVAVAVASADYICSSSRRLLTFQWLQLLLAL